MIDKKYKKFGVSAKGNLRITNEFGIPHPYKITPKHLEYNDQLELGKEQIEKMEAEHGSMCGFECGIAWNKHEMALMVECKLDIHTKKGRMNSELQNYLNKIKEKAQKNGYNGFAFLDKRKKLEKLK